MSSIQAILRKKMNKKGLYPLAIRITKNRKSSYLYLGQYLNQKDWDSIKQRVKKSHPNSTRLNNLIATELAKVNNSFLEIESKMELENNLADIKNSIRNKYDKNSFFSFAEKHLSNLTKNKKLSRVNSERPLLNRIKKFTKYADLDFKSITPNFLRSLIIYMRVQDSIGERSIVNTLVFIRTLFNSAIAQNLIKKEFYPFGKGNGKVKIKFPDSVKTGLNIEEVRAIENLDLSENKAQYHTQNVWLFSFYLAGMRIADVLKIKWSDIYDNRLHYRMNKNDKHLSLKIPQKLFPILDDYRHLQQSEDDYVFPELKKVNKNNPKDLLTKTKTATKKFNRHLVSIAKKAKISKKLTMHIARHSFGNISGDKIPIQMLQKLYRHSSITTTINYQANFMHKDTDDALDKVINF